MGKITVAGGASHAWDHPADGSPAVVSVESEVVAPAAEVVTPEPEPAAEVEAPAEPEAAAEPESDPKPAPSLSRAKS